MNRTIFKEDSSAQEKLNNGNIEKVQSENDRPEKEMLKKDNFVTGKSETMTFLKRKITKRKIKTILRKNLKNNNSEKDTPEKGRTVLKLIMFEKEQF